MPSLICYAQWNHSHVRAAAVWLRGQVTCNGDDFTARLNALSLSMSGGPALLGDDVVSRRIIEKWGINATAPGAKTIMLWYADWDGVANFNSFQPFGPFKANMVFAKQVRG